MYFVQLWLGLFKIFQLKMALGRFLTFHNVDDIVLNY